MGQGGCQCLGVLKFLTSRLTVLDTSSMVCTQYATVASVRIEKTGILRMRLLEMATSQIQRQKSAVASMEYMMMVKELLLTK